jgi:tetratricopeptide (TPR) repeat protein
LRNFSLKSGEPDVQFAPQEAGARLSIATVWSEMAVCYLGTGQDEKVMELFRQAELVNSESGAVYNYQVVLGNIGNVYLHRRDHFTAISYYRRALVLAHEIKDPVSIKKWTRNINLAYARIRQSVDRTDPRPSVMLGHQLPRAILDLAVASSPLGTAAAARAV